MSEPTTSTTRPTIYPVVLWTFFTSFIGGIPSARNRARRAKAAGFSARPYWVAFSVTLAVGLLLGVIGGASGARSGGTSGVHSGAATVPLSGTSTCADWNTDAPDTAYINSYAIGSAGDPAGTDESKIITFVSAQCGGNPGLILAGVMGAAILNAAAPPVPTH